LDPSLIRYECPKKDWGLTSIVNGKKIIKNTRAKKNSSRDRVGKTGSLIGIWRRTRSAQEKNTGRKFKKKPKAKNPTAPLTLPFPSHTGLSKRCGRSRPPCLRLGGRPRGCPAGGGPPRGCSGPRLSRPIANGLPCRHPSRGMNGMNDSKRRRQGLIDPSISTPMYIILKHQELPPSFSTWVKREKSAPPPLGE